MHGPPNCLVWPALRSKLLEKYTGVKFSMQLQSYIIFISVSNRGIYIVSGPPFLT